MKAQGIEAGSATTAGRGPKDESPVGEADAPALGANGVSQSAVELIARVEALFPSYAQPCFQHEYIDRQCANCGKMETVRNEALIADLRAALATQPVSDAGLREALVVKDCRIGSLCGQLDLLANKAAALMACLETHGAIIVPHLLDTDDNPGQYLREAIEQSRAALASTSDEVDTALNGEGDGGV